MKIAPLYTPLNNKKMGLDMYFISKDTDANVEKEVAYWRKANAIHKWFVVNCQNGVDDCRETPVTASNILTLLAACREAMANPAKAAEILPPSEGFFFGGMELDEWYFSNIENTEYILANLTGERGWATRDYFYSSSW